MYCFYGIGGDWNEEKLDGEIGGGGGGGVG